jgi:hypothetical protein
VDRRLTAAERLDLLGEDVASDHLVSELGEADGGHQANPANPDNAHRLALRAHPLLPPFFRFTLGTITSTDRAIPTI